MSAAPPSGEARDIGVQQERSRVIRCRNACFAGVRLTPAARDALVKFDGMLLRGEDPSTPPPHNPPREPRS